MAEDIKVNNLIINQLSNEKFATIEKDPTQLYLTPDTSIDASEKGVAGGVASLDSSGKIPTDQIPALPYLPTSGGTVNGDVSIKKGLGTIRSIMPESNGFTRFQVISGDGNYAAINIMNTRVTCGLTALDTYEFLISSTKDIKIRTGEGYKILDGHDNEILNSSMKAVPNGVASLDSDGKVPAEQLPEISGGTKRSIGEVYFSQSSLATDNSGALPLFTGETIASANTIYPDFYNWVSAHTELQCTSEEYESALSTYGECPKYATKFPVTNTVTSYKYDFSGATGISDSNYTSMLVGYENENGKFVQVTNTNVFYFNSIINTSEKRKAYLDPELTREARYRYSNMAETVSSGYLLAQRLAVGISLAQSSNGTTTHAWSINTEYIVLPTNYTYETVSSTVTSYETNGSLRLPKLANYLKMANRTDGITQSGAGLPNITGSLTNNKQDFENATGAFQLTGAAMINLYSANGASRSGNYGVASLDASLSSSVYGASDTVTPAHTTLYPWVYAFNSAVSASEAQAAEFTGALSGKVSISGDTMTGPLKVPTPASATNDNTVPNTEWIRNLFPSLPDYTAPVSQAFGTKYQSTGGWLYVSATNGNYGSGKCEIYDENDSLLYTFNFHMYYDPSVLFIPVPAGYYYWPKAGSGGAGYGGTVTFFPFKK